MSSTGSALRAAHPSPAASEGVRQGQGILARLKAAGVGKARERPVILQEIAVVKDILRKLKAEHRRAVSRDVLLRSRQDPEFEARRRARCMAAQSTPEFKARHKAAMAKANQPNRLPPMTHEQWRFYSKLRWTGTRMSRADALREVLGRT